MTDCSTICIVLDRQRRAEMSTNIIDFGKISKEFSTIVIIILMLD